MKRFYRKRRQSGLCIGCKAPVRNRKFAKCEDCRRVARVRAALKRETLAPEQLIQVLKEVRESKNTEIPNG